MNKQLLAAMRYLAKVRPKDYRLTKWELEQGPSGDYFYVVKLQQLRYEDYYSCWYTICEAKIEAKL